jgi:hypothetical protein
MKGFINPAWEYYSEIVYPYAVGTFDKFLCDKGEEGWELVTVISLSPGYKAVFKRRSK